VFLQRKQQQLPVLSRALRELRFEQVALEVQAGFQSAGEWLVEESGPLRQLVPELEGALRPPPEPE
jgi:hypothetical protein